LASVSIGSKVFGVILVDLKKLFEDTDDLDLRWAVESTLDDAIAWCGKMAMAQQVEGSPAAQYFQEFIDSLTAMLSGDSTKISKSSLMFAIDDLELDAGVNDGTDYGGPDEEAQVAGDAEAVTEAQVEAQTEQA